MNFKKSVVVLALSSVFLGGCSFPSFVQKKAGLQVTVLGNDKASVMMDSKDLGMTPYTSNEIKPGTYTIKLTPEDKSKAPYETKVNLKSGLVTVVNWSFGKSMDESGGEILELTKISGNKIELSLLTNPDNIIVKLDGQTKGFTPYVFTDIGEGQHSITLTAPGYTERTMNPKLTPGYRLTVTSKLAREAVEQTAQTSETPENSNATPSASPKVSPKPSSSPKASPKTSPKPSATPTASPKSSPKPSATPKTTSTTPDLPYVEIKETGTGWLRVRAEANSSAEEVAKLDTGSKVPYLGETVSGWHKVEYSPGKEGWVSGQYAVVHKE